MYSATNFEKLAVVEIVRLNNIIIMHNNTDLVKPDAAATQHDQIRRFFYRTVEHNVTDVV